MRCFLAIELPVDVKKELNNVQKQLENENIKANFVKLENLHITLKFFGEIDDFKVNKIKEKLKQIKFEPFKVKINNLGVFTPQFIRVIWIDVFPKEQLIKLQQQIDAELEKIDFKKEKNFETHITIARVKWIKDKNELLKKLQKIKIRPVEFEINSFVLKKSILTEQGPIYENIFQYLSKQNPL